MSYFVESPRNRKPNRKVRMFQTGQKQVERESNMMRACKQDDENKDRFVSCSTIPDCLTSENFGDLKPLGDLRMCSSYGLCLRFVVHRLSGIVSRRLSAYHIALVKSPCSRIWPSASQVGPEI